jgi:hypothetical protein
MPPHLHRRPPLRKPMPPPGRVLLLPSHYPPPRRESAPAPQPPLHLPPAFTRRPFRHPVFHRPGPPAYRRQRDRPSPSGLLLYGLQIASLNLPKIQPAKTAESQTVSQTVEEITIDPILGVLAPRTEVSDIAKRKSPVAQLIERMMQKEEKPVPTPEPATIPTLQACSSPLNPTQPRQMSFRPERSAVEKSASPTHLPPPHSACAAAGPPPRNAKKRLPAQTQKTSFRPKAAHLPPQWRNPLLQLNIPASAPSLRKESALCSFGLSAGV